MKKITAGVFIINKDNKILVCHPTNHSQNFWSISKGAVEDGEILIDAAIRETFEETNIDLKGVSGLKTLKFVEYKNGKKSLHAFLCWEPAVSGLDWYGFDLKCNSFVPIEKGGFPEMDDYKWVTLSEAREIMHEAQVKILDEIEEIIGKV